MFKVHYQSDTPVYFILCNGVGTYFYPAPVFHHNSQILLTVLTSPTPTRNMKEAIVSAGPKVEIVDSPIPIPEPDQVVTKVVVSGTNPKDWKRPQSTGTASNQGDDIAGIVHSVGSNVVEFNRGDRVAAFHQMAAPGGSYAEYAVSYDHATFHIPKKTTFEG